MIFQNIKKIDQWLLGGTLFILIVQLLLLYSIERGTGQFDDLTKSIIFILLGGILYVVVASLDYSWLRSFAFFGYVFALLLLIGVLLFGTTIRGTTGWFRFGPLSFQPVEMVKILLVIFFASFFAKKYEHFSLSHLFRASFLLILPVAFILLQPDLGSAFIIIAFWSLLLFFTRIKRRYLLLLFGIFFTTAIFSWFFLLAPYQKDRILTFVHPESDPLRSGYQIRQAITAVGSGKFWGRGLGFGSQSQLRFLPESEADFIFSVLAEEFGFFGTALMIFVYIFIMFRIWKIIIRAPDGFSFFLSLGILFLFSIQVCINIGMNLGLAPITGIPLPLLSSGGSSLLGTLMALAIVQNIGIKLQNEKSRSLPRI